MIVSPPQCINTLRPRQNSRHFADDAFKRIFWDENVRISIEMSLKFVPKGPINNIPALVHIMAWRRPGDKPLSKPMIDNLPTHICVTRPQWVIIWPEKHACLDYIYIKVNRFLTREMKVGTDSLRNTSLTLHGPLHSSRLNHIIYTKYLINPMIVRVLQTERSSARRHKWNVLDHRYYFRIIWHWLNFPYTKSLWEHFRKSI